MQLKKHNTLSEESECPKLFNTQISSLLFADDMAVFFLSLRMGYKKLDILEKYCRQWDLNLNLKKTNVIIFNKQGNTKKKLSFIIGEKKLKLQANIPIQVLHLYHQGKKYAGIENLMKKGKKTWFSIQRMLSKSKEKTVDTYLKLMS